MTFHHFYYHILFLPAVGLSHLKLIDNCHGPFLFGPNTFSYVHLDNVKSTTPVGTIQSFFTFQVCVLLVQPKKDQNWQISPLLRAIFYFARLFHFFPYPCATYVETGHCRQNFCGFMTWCRATSDISMALSFHLLSSTVFPCINLTILASLHKCFMKL